MNKIQRWAAKNLLGVDLKALMATVSPIVNYGTQPVTFIGDTSEQFIREGFGANEIVYSILTIAADKERMPPWAVYKVKNESSLKQYSLEMHKVGSKEFNVKKALDFRTKALELYTGDSKLNKILEWPNDNETFNDLVANSGISKRATGKRFIRATLLDSGPNKGKPQELHLLPAQHVTIVNSQTFPSRILGYDMQLGTRHHFAPEEVMYDRLYNPVYNVAGFDLDGMSPLQAARYTLNSYKAASIAGVKSFDNLGPETVLYPDDPKLSDPADAFAQLSATKKELKNNSGARNRKVTVVSGYKVGVAQLGLSPVDLALLESKKWDAITLCNIYNFPHIILSPEHATLDNMKVATRELLTRCSLPYLVSFRNQFNRELRTDWGYKGQNIFVDFDLSVFAELQADMKMLTDWLQKAWWLTIRQKYELMQMEIPKEMEGRPELDMIFIPSGYQEIGNLNPANLDDEMNSADELDGADQ